MTTRIQLSFLLLFIAGNTAAGQIDSDNHTVTVQVQEITSLELDIGSVMMTISGAGLIAGQDTMTVSDQSSTLRWGSNAAGIKVTVMSGIGAPRYAMSVAAVNRTAGTPTGEVLLSGNPVDFLVDLGMSAGNCRILYKGIATASQGTGIDDHIVTFTIQDQ
ncbi:MAG: hypothetical protein OEV30_13645 [Ignavibacteria bacterium]|nr:hypothetical protein [Ignavibacteria bacterium]